MLQVPAITAENLAELYSDIVRSTGDTTNCMQAQRACTFFTSDGTFASREEYHRMMDTVFLPCAQFIDEINPCLHDDIMHWLCVLDDSIKRQRS